MGHGMPDANLGRMVRVSALEAIIDELATDYTDSDERLISIKAIAAKELEKLR